MWCIMDCVEEVPERELPDRDEERELGFISLALGASASSLKGVSDNVAVTTITKQQLQLINDL